MSTIIFCPRCRKQFTHSNKRFERCPHCENRVANSKYVPTPTVGFWDDAPDDKVRVEPNGLVEVNHFVTLNKDILLMLDVIPHVTFPKGSKGTIHYVSTEVVSILMQDDFDCLDDDNKLLWHKNPSGTALELFKADIEEPVKFIFSEASVKKVKKESFDNAVSKLMSKEKTDEKETLDLLNDLVLKLDHKNKEYKSKFNDLDKRINTFFKPLS